MALGHITSLLAALLAASVAALLTLGGCGGPEGAMLVGPVAPPAVAPTGDTALGLFPGESMTFLVKLAGIEVGEAALAVGELDNTLQPARISVHSRINASGAAALVTTFVDDATTSIDAATGHPIALATSVVQGKKSYTSNATFTATGAEVLYQKPEDVAPKPISFNFQGRPVHDAHSAMADLRHWRPQIGAQRTVYIIGGRRLWRIDLTAAGAEVVGTALGNRKTQRLNGRAFRARPDLSVDPGPPGRTFTVWMSDDGDRVPLRVTAETELGSVEIDLQEYNRP